MNQIVLDHIIDNFIRLRGAELGIKSRENLNYERAKRKSPSAPLVVGISGPQGSGKTTLTANVLNQIIERKKTNIILTVIFPVLNIQLIRLLETTYNLKAICFSLDDFYYSFTDQQKIRHENPNNPLLEYRGNPGTHDIPLLLNFFERVASKQRIVTASHEGDGNEETFKTLKIPRFDKSLRGGRGDRCNIAEWNTATLPVDVILFEGWCLGFQAVLDSSRVERIINNASSIFENTSDHVFDPNLVTLDNLMQVQANLADFQNVVYKFIDVFVHIFVEDITVVYDWRIEQEESMRTKAGDFSVGLSVKQVEKSVFGYF
ncbi:hypothetical protein HK100_001458 [Physocladia obscura]|uniref:P-loop containing nucleoside triphosphate hydrolase protein n=1 Tax=Physocladia obscura TaxID=109957 RepID=A0AAD5SXU7_9FUNG|nr:hypothetical protein HK100_001458 [Physocladia obscura]